MGRNVPWPLVVYVDNAAGVSYIRNPLKIDLRNPLFHLREGFRATGLI